MKRKSVLIIAILIMSIGFAAISTTLIINGNTKVSENAADFSVIFTKAKLDGEDVYANVISQDKKTITFETKDLKSVNDNSVLTYEITNNSSNYDAEVSVNCKVKDEGSAKYTSIKNEFEGNATKVLAKESINGKLTINLEKIATEEIREEYVCALTFNALERDTLGETYSGPTEWTFNYTGSEQTFTVPISGTYQLEAWGAQGGHSQWSYGGNGGYSSGSIYLNKNDTLTIVVGGQGGGIHQSGYWGNRAYGGYNGGGSSGLDKDGNDNGNNETGGGGGGFTIVKKTDISYICAGGGGGGGGWDGPGGSGSAGGGGGSGSYADKGNNGTGAEQCGNSIIGGNGGAAKSAAGVGSAWINETYVKTISVTSGVRSGNGTAKISLIS